jgi:hypothetical protein
MDNQILDSFKFPDDTLDGIKKLNLKSSAIDDGVSRFISGHDQGVAYKFFIHAEYNAAKSKAGGYEVFDEIEMIEWYPDSCCKPTERVRLLPEALLHIDEFTGEVYGKYAEAYKNFKTGKAQVGTQLSKWGILSDGQIATLNANHIYTVEQFAAFPKAKISSKFPTDFIEAWDRAQQFLASKEQRFEADKRASELAELAQKNAKLENELNELRKMVAQGLDQNLHAGTVKKKPGRPKKEVTNDQV